MPYSETPRRRREERAFGPASWRWTLACGIAKLLFGLAAIFLPLLEGRPLAASVGWLLILGGLAEWLLGWGARRSEFRRLNFLSGGVTILAGLLFILRPTGVYGLTTIVIAWLFARGLIELMEGLRYRPVLVSVSWWLWARGIVDGALAVALLAGLPITALMVLLFGGTREVVTAFGLVLSISFLVSGAGFLAIAGVQRRWEAGQPPAN
jgi:uncharacterized membrane protein HdeD (DUF308 family)